MCIFIFGNLLNYSALCSHTRYLYCNNANIKFEYAERMGKGSSLISAGSLPSACVMMKTLGLLYCFTYSALKFSLNSYMMAKVIFHSCVNRVQESLLSNTTSLTHASMANRC